MRGSAAGCTRRTILACGVASLTASVSRSGGVEQRATDGFVVLQAGPGRLDMAGGRTDVWCFDGAVPGPVVRARAGDEVRVRLINRLDAPLSLHWQGVRIANAMDGVAGLTQPPVPPGGSFDYRFTPPDSGTFLYHPVVPNRPLAPLGAGLNGLLVVEEREPPAVDREFLLAATSVRLDRAGRLVDPDAVGKTVLGIGGLGEAERLTLPQGARLRLRAVNASPTALLILGVEGAGQSVIAVDSQPCEPFTPARGMIPLGPGARFDVVLELPRSAGTTARVTLRDPLDKASDTRAVLELHTGNDAAPQRSAPTALPANPRLPEAIALERAIRAELVLSQPPRDVARRAAVRPSRAVRIVLSPHLDAGKPVVSVKRGTPMVFALANPSPLPASVHVHGHVMRVLHDLDDGWHPYWRDTVLVEPGKTHHVAFIADKPGRWLIAAQMLGSSSSAFGWYEVR